MKRRHTGTCRTSTDRSCARARSAWRAGPRILAAVLASLGIAGTATLGPSGPARLAHAQGQTPLETGLVQAIGSNLEGQIGNGSRANAPAMAAPLGAERVIGVSAGPWHSLALKADGTVWSWGDNDSGQLGDGSTERRLTPVQVSGLARVVQLAHTGYHSAALREDGTVWTWGRNEVGQLGTATTTLCTWDDFNGPETGPCSTVPVQVSGLAGVPNRPGSIAAGAQHTLAVRSDGTVWAWGDDRFDQLGADARDRCPDRSLRCAHAPLQVKGPRGEGVLTGIVAVAAGWFHSMALASDGTVYAWGSNLFGQVGNGADGGNVPYPTRVVGPDGTGALTGIALPPSGTRGPAIEAGEGHSLALHSDGTVYAWGRNDAGQVGAETTQLCWPSQQVPCIRQPVQVQGLRGVVSVVAGRYHSAAITVNAEAWGWGKNQYNQLAHPSTDQCRFEGVPRPCARSPQRMSQLPPGITFLSAGQEHTLAIGIPPPPAPQPTPSR